MSISVLPRPDVAPPRPWFFPRAQRVVLGNGLTVVAFDMPGKKIAAVSALIDLPHQAEPTGLEGLASITAQALDEGTSRYDSQGFAEARNRIGATYHATSDSNGGVISLSVPAVKLGAALDLLAQALLTPTFPTTEVDRLVKQRLDGIANELANPGTRAQIELAKVYYAAGSRRCIPGGGTTESVARIDREAVVSFFNAQVDPASTTLVIAADLAGLDLASLIGEYFGAWATAGRTRSSVPAAQLARKPGVVVVDRPGSVQSQLLFAAPSVVISDPDAVHIQVACYALGGGMESRLMTVLREEKGYTYGINATLQTDQAGGRFFVGSAVQTEVTGPAVTDLVNILRTFAAGGVREDERVPAVEALAGRAPLAYETPQAVVNGAVSNIANGLPDDYVDHRLAAIRGTTVDGINAAFQRGVALPDALLVAVGDGSVITEALGAAGLGEVTVVPA